MVKHSVVVIESYAGLEAIGAKGVLLSKNTFLNFNIIKINRFEEFGILTTI